MTRYFMSVLPTSMETLAGMSNSGASSAHDHRILGSSSQEEPPIQTLVPGKTGQIWARNNSEKQHVQNLMVFEIRQSGLSGDTCVATRADLIKENI